jgi:hypothetical protein
MSALMSTAAQGTPLFRVSINHLVYAQAHEVFNSCLNDLPLPLEALPGLNSPLRRQAAMACIRRAPSGLSTPQQIFKEAVTHNLPKIAFQLQGRCRRLQPTGRPKSRREQALGHRGGVAIRLKL